MWETLHVGSKPNSKTECPSVILIKGWTQGKPLLFVPVDSIRPAPCVASFPGPFTATELFFELLYNKTASQRQSHRRLGIDQTAQLLNSQEVSHTRASGRIQPPSNLMWPAGASNEFEKVLPHTSDMLSLHSPPRSPVWKGSGTGWYKDNGHLVIIWQWFRLVAWITASSSSFWRRWLRICRCDIPFRIKVVGAYGSFREKNTLCVLNCVNK